MSISLSEVTPPTEQDKNWEFARQLSRDTRADPASPYAGKYVGVLHQQVVMVADSLRELTSQLDVMGIDPQEAVGIEASADYDQIYMIWRS